LCDPEADLIISTGLHAGPLHYQGILALRKLLFLLNRALFSLFAEKGSYLGHAFKNFGPFIKISVFGGCEWGI